jgi:hypothetical protein
MRGSVSLLFNCALNMAIKAPVADHAAVGASPEKQIRKIDGAQMRPAQGLLFIARRTDKAKSRHGSNLPQKVYMEEGLT